MNEKRILSRRSIYFRRLSPLLDGLKIIFLSDLHFSPFRRPINELVVRTVVDEKPDLVILGGDLVDYKQRWSEVLSWIEGISMHGAFVAVPGNWEYYNQETSTLFAKRMRSVGVVPLCNETVSFMKKGLVVKLTGVDDYHGGMPNINAAFRGVECDDFCIGVSHSPAVLVDLEPRHPCHLMLCGHTHGGQFRLPGYGAVFTNTGMGKRYEQGLYQLGDERFAYVSRGLGEGVVKMRLFCPPEIVIITLHHRWP